jgi:hypothetical protein
MNKRSKVDQDFETRLNEAETDSNPSRRRDKILALANDVENATNPLAAVTSLVKLAKNHPDLLVSSRIILPLSDALRLLQPDDASRAFDLIETDLIMPLLLKARDRAAQSLAVGLDALVPVQRVERYDSAFRQHRYSCETMANWLSKLPAAEQTARHKALTRRAASIQDREIRTAARQALKRLFGTPKNRPITGVNPGPQSSTDVRAPVEAARRAHLRGGGR